MANAGPGLMALLQQLMTSGQEVYGKGEDIAARELGVGDDPAQRGTMRKAALGGAAAAGVLGLLLGTRTGRGVAKTGALAGGIGLLGKLAYDAYTQYAGAAAAKEEAPPIGDLDGEAADSRARAILAAMIAAAKADGHIDAREKAMITARLGEIGADAKAFLAAELERPLDAIEIAGLADSDQTGREIYAVSALICQGYHQDERAYLDRLAGALRLPLAVTREIDAKVAAG